MYINNEWDKEYREQREAFRRYQDDAQQAQMENHTAIARLKEKLATVEEERDSLEDELARHQRELHSLRERLAMAESLGEGVGRGGAEEGEVARLKEELFFAKQQVCVCVFVCVYMCMCVCYTSPTAFIIHIVSPPVGGIQRRL